MASATIMKFPDGRTESKNILTSFDKNGTNIIVFETDKVDNGHKVVGVSYLSDGMYQNVVDPTKWNEVKGYLVDILHDRMTLGDYRLVPEEIMVTVDPYHPLGLRDENLEKIVASYEAFKATKEVSIEPAQEILESPVVEEAKTEEVEPTENIIESAPQVNEEVVLNDSPLIVDEQLPKEEGLTIETKPIEVEPVLDPFAIADSLEASANTMESTHEDIIPPVGVDIVDSPVIDTQVLNSIEPEVVVENVPINEDVTTKEEVDISFPQPVLEPQNSVVKDAYLNGADAIIQQMRDTTEKYLNEMNELQENYIKEMEEMRSEISRNLEEARGINELSKQTFDKAQSLSPIEQPVLELTRAA